MANWYCQRDGEQMGPISSEELKELAASGRITPGDLVRPQDRDRWVKAGRVAGLFPEPRDAPTHSPGISSRTGTRHESHRTPVPDLESSIRAFKEEIPWQKINAAFQKPAVIGVTLAMCFPLGIFLICRNPDWSRKRKVKWIAPIVALFVLSGAVGAVQRKAALAAMEQANVRWDSGSQGEAVDVYEQLLSEKWTVLNPAERKTLLRRTVEFHVQNGRSESAAKWIRFALDKNELPTMEDARASSLVSRLQAAEKDGSASSDASRDTTTGAITAEELKEMSYSQIVDLLGQPDEDYRNPTKRNVGLAIWKVGDNDYTVVGFIHAIDGSRRTLILTAFVHRTQSIVERMKRALSNTFN